MSQYLWDFGDGNSSTAAEPTHVWDTPGTYTVQLTVDNGACDATISMDVTVDVNTGIRGTDGLAGMQVFATADAIIITQDPTQAACRWRCSMRWAARAISREHISMSGRISLPTAQLGTGVWYVRVTSTDGQRTFRVPLMRRSSKTFPLKGLPLGVALIVYRRCWLPFNRQDAMNAKATRGTEPHGDSSRELSTPDN